jgi:hypothetical protein
MPQSSISSSAGTAPSSLIGASINPSMILPSSMASTGFGKCTKKILSYVDTIQI